MAVRIESELIYFDNLLEAASSGIAGDNQNIKAKQASAKSSPYVQENAAGELYRPLSLQDVADRAQRAAARFNTRSHS